MISKRSRIQKIIESFEKKDLGVIQSKTGAFAVKYRPARDEIDQKAETMAYAGVYYHASYHYTELLAGIENIGQHETLWLKILCGG